MTEEKGTEMKIDIYTHILPQSYKEAIEDRLTEDVRNILYRAEPLWDLEQRFRIMDKYDDYMQVLTFAVPPIESISNVDESAELARRGNDELAQILTKYPERFLAGVANLPMENIDATLKEADRAIKELGLKGVQVYSNVNGEPLDAPEYMPLYEMMAEYDLPIWIHPRRDNIVPDYVMESESKYALYGALGWPFETQIAMCRLVCSGVLEKFPKIKFITHHCGAGIPYFANRIESWVGGFIKRSRDSDENLKKLTKGPVEYLRMFYVDTAISGNTSAMMLGHSFYGTDHLLFGTDMPFGGDQGEQLLMENEKAVMEMSITDSEREKILASNARQVLNLLT